MDNLTHSLVGLTAAKAGLERLSPGATVLCVLAANSPDSDIIVLAFGDRWDFLLHHRGITHAIVGVVFLSLLLPLIFTGVDRLWARLRHRPPKTKFRGLLIASFIVSATHPLLDWTNNYGIRFLLPWNPRWFYGDLVFIVDPFIWVVLGGAAFLLASKTKIGKFVWATIAAVITFMIVAGPRSSDLPNPTLIAGLWIGALILIIVLFVTGARERWGEKIALVAFGLVLAYWSALAFAHASAVRKGSEEANRITAPYGEQVSRAAAMPTLANPLRWDFVFETDKATYRFPVALNGQTPSGRVIRYPKPSGKLAASLEAVSREKSAHVFLDFARFPVAKLREPDCTTQTLLQLADLRYTEPGRSRGTFALELPVDCPDDIHGAFLGGR
ncbi:MAG TPA: metal-dependent hydrolase [Pyrinomonadaceae bacterium]|nr:metal-dependent hydrolase [Pyrinomonadaceae bacterium]